MRHGFCHFWMGRMEMLLPFCSKPNHPIMDVVEKLHGAIYVLLMPNAAGERRATGKNSRTGRKHALSPVRSTGLFGAADRPGQLPRFS
jgi:hypothetical protein